MDDFFSIDEDTLRDVLAEYGIVDEITNTNELLRYHYQKYDRESKEIRLIVRVSFRDRTPVVTKFVNETEHPRSLIEEQSAFSEHLNKRGMAVARRYLCGDCYCMFRNICEIPVNVTVEDFVEGEIKLIDNDNIFKIGALLATSHCISEEDDCHVHGDTLFNVLMRNDLFSYDDFIELKSYFSGQELNVFHQIQQLYDQHMGVLQKLTEYKMYAIQGDISQGNLYTTTDGKIGMFDFNNCGDNYLLSDAILEGMFMARLMDYREPLTLELSNRLFRAFLNGYASVRPFTDVELDLIPFIYSITSAFWLFQVKYGNESLLKLLENEEYEAAARLLDSIHMLLYTHIPVRSWLIEGA